MWHPRVRLHCVAQPLNDFVAWSKALLVSCVEVVHMQDGYIGQHLHFVHIGETSGERTLALLESA